MWNISVHVCGFRCNNRTLFLWNCYNLSHHKCHIKNQDLYCQKPLRFHTEQKHISHLDVYNHGSRHTTVSPLQPQPPASNVTIFQFHNSSSPTQTLSACVWLCMFASPPLIEGSLIWSPSAPVPDWSLSLGWGASCRAALWLAPFKAFHL